MVTRYIVEGRGGDVISFALTDERVVFEQILDFRLAAIRLSMKDFLGLFSGSEMIVSMEVVYL